MIEVKVKVKVKLSPVHVTKAYRKQTDIYVNS